MTSSVDLTKKRLCAYTGSQPLCNLNTAFTVGSREETLRKLIQLELEISSKNLYKTMFNRSCEFNVASKLSSRSALCLGFKPLCAYIIFKMSIFPP